MEVNPQGQFLFVEGLVPGLGLTEALARFLRQRAIAGRASKARRHD